ncbi:hypothetical protein [Natrialba sp. PRR66]|uniref:hypothetical protein n=1 Tax=Natrialba sp. PRR66 TaxID=3098146 RepID=UPI002B1D6800|nr:hypothetical protein [Natrialba sp. PRR66]
MSKKTTESGQLGDEYTINTIDDNNPDDLYFTSAGFEERTLAATESLDSDYRAEWGIIYVNKEYFERSNKETTKEHLKKLQKSLEQHCDEVDVLMGSWLEADEQLFTLRDGLQVLTGRNSLDITVDITTFNREALLVSFNILYSLSNNITTRILYATPQEHGEWLSSGYRLVRNIIGFAGIQNSSKPTLLVILSGFEQDRVINTIEETEPAKVLMGIGDPPTKEHFLDENKQRQELVLNRQDTERFYFPANSISGSRQVIDDLISEYSDEYNILLSPMSTKLSTLGAWDTARNSEEVQVLYTVPGNYNLENYSSGIGSLYVNWI